MARTITLTSTVLELDTVLHALIAASNDAEGDAWLASTKAQQNPEDSFYQSGAKVAQAHNEAMRKALDCIYNIVWSAHDEAGHFVHVTKEADLLKEAI